MDYYFYSFVTMNKIYIYGLMNPESREIRYVGKTGNINNRYLSHINASKRLKTHLGAWIKSLISKNMLPEIIILEECSEENWEEREITWISFYPNLVNKQKGGNQPSTHKKAFKKYSSSRKKYKVNCSYNNTVYYLGSFVTTIEAERRYDDFQKDPIKIINTLTPKYNKQPIEMLKDNILIREFKSVSEASKELGIIVSNISANCRGKNKTCRGYVFRYKSTDEE